jgi:hypothetical protein
VDAAAAGLTGEQAAMLSAIAERLIPSDDTGPGAAEAMAARYVLRALAADYREHRAGYARGLTALDARARKQLGAGFAALAAEQQDALLAELEGGDAESAAFFELVRRHVVEGMFGDPVWGGNAEQAGWKLLGYPGPRHVWTAEEQRLS